MFPQFTKLFSQLTRWFLNEPNVASTYRSQGEMLDALDRSEEPGLCSPLSNLVAKGQITQSSQYDILSQSNFAVYSQARKEEDHQRVLRGQGKDAKHSAFIDQQLNYQVLDIPAAHAKSLSVSDILPEPGHSLITYPVTDSLNKKEDFYHQVYFGKPSLEECISFDPESFHGIQRGACEPLLKEIKNKMSLEEDKNRPEKRVIVATTSSFYQRKINAKKPEESSRMPEHCAKIF